MTVAWGPTGQLVYERTYSRTKPDGTKETWPETVQRVVDGNLALRPDHLLPNERERLIEHMTAFKIIPGGRHLWASGVAGRQYLFNCHVSGWSPDVTEHFQFTFLRLMEGGGVGANYSNRYLNQYGPMCQKLNVHVVCDPEHPDYERLRNAGVLSDAFDADWPGAYEVEDSREGWAGALVDLVSTYYRPAKYTDRVYDVSRVRGEGTRLKTFGGRASGPTPLAVMLHEVSTVLNAAPYGRLHGMAAMEIDHAIAKCVVSGGNRRSARMSIMRWDDPEIKSFINSKKDGSSHWTTNISVEVDDEFFARANAGRPDASHVLAMIAGGMLDNGEPGIWNSQLSNRGEPNTVVATNPCGEIALESWENCNLGHVNLAKFANRGPDDIDWMGLYEAHVLMARFLMRATYGDVNDPKQAEVLSRNRRIGLGHLGFASFLARLGIKYSEASRNYEVSRILEDLAQDVDDAVRDYAHQLRIPIPVKIRTVAPTGTIAKMPGVSEGIHPIFGKYFIRRVRLSTIDPDQFETATRYAAQGYEVEPDLSAPNTVVVSIPTKDSLLEEVATLYGEARAEEIVESAADLTLEQMLSVQEMYQRYWADNAVSYTANIDPAKYTLPELANVLLRYGTELKGTTVFPEKSFAQAPYERITKDAYKSATVRDVADGVDDECATGACPVR
ncbi:ribonucleoside-triphosphate reductase, adenosylcobalamin-dependent [Saccharothrix sp. HUAS TT1]|uniref:ribonucleoside-triphosphate reductase, adenosylcobalamin-dependent n=1 Tax=unclassified Saccharothrix TaxID=2593673 RepID=UPI00345BC62D